MGDLEVGNLEPENAGLQRVLLVDDDPTIRDVVSLMLERLDFSPVTAATGKEALEAVKESVFEIVLMDVHMPEMDGIEATRRIRGEAPDDHQPAIIAMTANSEASDRDVCTEAGMNYFLPKPIRMAELTAVMQSSSGGSS